MPLFGLFDTEYNPLLPS